MAWNEGRAEISVTAAMLQKRAIVAAKHVKTALNGIRQIYLNSDKAESVSSYDSTATQLRLSFGHA